MAYPQYVTKDPVQLDGFQAVLKPSEHGFGLQVLVDSELINQLNADRESLIKNVTGKVDAKKLKRMQLALPPWEDVAEDTYRLKFSWDAKKKPVIIDSVGTVIDDDTVKLYSGSLVKVSFYQKDYVFGSSYGTSIKILGIQVIQTSDGSPRLSVDSAMEMFGTTDGGFVTSDVEDADLDDEEEGEEEEGTEESEY
jgi:hypothetical protein